MIRARISLVHGPDDDDMAFTLTGPQAAVRVEVWDPPVPGGRPLSDHRVGEYTAADLRDMMAVRDMGVMRVPLGMGDPASGGPPTPEPYASAGAMVWVVLRWTDRMGAGDPEVYDLLCEAPPVDYLAKLRGALHIVRDPQADWHMAVVPMRLRRPVR